MRLRPLHMLLLVMLASPLHGGDEDVRAQLAELRRDIANNETQLRALRQAADDKKLDEVVRDEVREIIASGGPAPGDRKGLGGISRYYDGKFHLDSEDGRFRLNVGGFVQFRYIYNHAADRAVDDEEGFMFRRARLIFSGYALDPHLNYYVQIDGRRTDGIANLIHAWVSCDFADGWQVLAGQARIPFLREESVSAQRLMAVERSYLNFLFTADRAEMVQVSYTGARWRAAATVFDGTSQYNTDFTDENAQFAFAGRAELLAAGKWSQFDDMAAWSSEPTGLLLGLAADYEIGRGAPGAAPDLLKYSADVSWEHEGLSGLLAFVGHRISDHAGPGDASAADQRGYLAQVAAFIIPDKLNVFARYEFIELSGLAYRPVSGLVAPAPDNQLHILTVGSNYYFHQHDLKLTLDIVWTPDQIPLTSTGNHLLADAADGQLLLRSQFQWRF